LIPDEGALRITWKGNRKQREEDKKTDILIISYG
jgi:hypothetical protein